MKLSNYPNQSHLLLPDNWKELETYKLIEEMGWFTFIDRGLPTLDPIGKKVNSQLEDLVRQISENMGFMEVSFPRIYSDSIIEKSGKMEAFSDEIISLDGDMKGFSLAATTEEIFIEFLKKSTLSHRQLPIKLFKVQDAFRNIKRSKGIVKSIQFSGADFMTLNRNHNCYRNSLDNFSQIFDEMVEQLDIEVLSDLSFDGQKVEFFFEDEQGEKIKRSSIVGNESKLKEGGKFSSLGMGYPVVPNEAQDINYADENGGLAQPIVGTFGIGMQKVFYASVYQHRDELGINFPSPIRPFDFSIIPISDDESIMNYANFIYSRIKSGNSRTYLDDRKKMYKTKAAFSDFMGVPNKLIIGNDEVLNNNILVKTRAGRSSSMSLEELIKNGR